MKKKIYFGAGLFSAADLMFNEYVGKKIDELNTFTMYMPQRNTAINDKTKCATSVQIYDGDTEELKTSNILVALIDGPVIDPGLAAEIGWFCREIETEREEAMKYGEDPKAVKKTIIALFSDTRDGTHTPAGPGLDAKAKALNEGLAESQFPYANLYVIGGIKKYGTVVSSVDELIGALEKAA